MIEIPDSVIEDAARLAYEAVRVYSESIDDRSLLPWDDASTWQKRTTINNVRYVVSNPNFDMSVLVDSWMLDTEDCGWVDGPITTPQDRHDSRFLPVISERPRPLGRG